MVKRYSIEVAGPKGVPLPTRRFLHKPTQEDLRGIAACVDEACGSKPTFPSTAMIPSFGGRYDTPNNNHFYLGGSCGDRVEVQTTSARYSYAELKKRLADYDGQKRW